MPAGGFFSTMRGLINTGSTESSETGAASHTPRCKIMSLQWKRHNIHGRGQKLTYFKSKLNIFK